MADGQREAQWEHTAAVAAAFLSAFGDDVHPNKLNPYAPNPGTPGMLVTADNIDILQELVD